MSELSKYLTEQILLEDESVMTNIIVVYSGRFQPFHDGHYKTYKHLVQKFGRDNVYIGTSNSVSLPKSPFSFKEKQKIMNTMFGIPTHVIVQLKNPYTPTEILSKYDEKTTAYITVVGEKDSSRLGGKYFTKYDGDPTEGYRDKGYVYIAPKQSNAVSGTEVRMGLGNGTDEEKKEFFTKRAYPKFDKKIFDLVTDKLDETIIIDKETIEDWLVNSNILKESSANINQTNSADDGPTFMFPNYDVFTKISNKRAKKIGYEVVNMIMTKELEDYYEHPTYPNGPANAVSYYPAGVMGANTPNNQIDIYSNGAFAMWYKHMTRKATLSGYELVYTQIERDASKKLSKLAGADAKGDKRSIQKTPSNSLKEAITLPVEIGDTLLMGKFKNKKVVVKTIGKDEHGLPTINGKKVVTFRYHKKGPNIFDHIVELAGTEMRCTKCGHQWPLEVEDKENYTCHNCGWDSQSQKYNMDSEYIKKNGLLGKPKTQIYESRIKLIESVITQFKNLGISRKDMPQIESSKVSDFLKYLKDKGISHKKGNVEIHTLKLTQKELNKDKIDKMTTVSQSVLSKPIIVSKDGYIMDGHHRVLAKYALNNGDTIPTIVINLPIKELLKVAHQYEDVGYKTVHEVVSINELSKEDKLKKIEVERDSLRKKVEPLVAKKKKLYSNMDITSPKSADEKKLDKDIADLYSKMNQLVSMKRKLNKESIISIQEAKNDLKLNIPSDIKKIHSAFKKSGKKLYVVGGAVRDAILGKSPKDFDLATDAKPDETLEIAKKAGFSTAEVGKAFGVVIVGGHEIATFRKDIGKGRRPDAVDYTDIAGDVKRRDLTINALFYDMDRGEIVDLVGGIEDLKKNKIRTVGKASERFEEDPLRKLRALRFQTKLGGKMDTDLLIALKQDPTLNGVSSERIRDEFLKSIQSSKDTSKYMETLDKIGFTKLILPGLKISKPYINDNDEIIFLSYLLRDNDPSTLGKPLNKLNYTSDEAKNIVFLNSLQKFKPENIYSFKKSQERTTLSDEQISKFGKLIGNDMKKFLNFKLSVKGSEVPSDVKGPEIGKWIMSKEKEKFLNELVKIKGNTDTSDIAVNINGKKYKFIFSSKFNMGKINPIAIQYPNERGYRFLDKDIEAENLWKLNKTDFIKALNTKSKDTWDENLNESVNEMSKQQLDTVEKFADKELAPDDVVFTKHFFDRVNDPRNGKEISDVELRGFFNRLKKYKKKFVEFLTKYNQMVVTDKRTDINIPFVKQANKVIAKTVMRKQNFKSQTPVFAFENDSIENLYNDIDEMFNSMESNVITEGGAYGHMNHPFDTEINLTFGQLKDIVKKALNGDLELTREKTDGQALAVTWKDGKLLAARNKGHLKNKGENALDIKGVADKFKGRGELEKAYNFAMNDLSNAISKLSDKQKEKIFQDGGSFMNLEVIYPTSVNVIPYGQALLVFHGTMQYNLDGVAIGENQDAGKILAGMIKQVNQDVQDKYTIQGPPVIELPKSQDLSKKQSKYNSEISKLQREFKLSDSDGVGEYHQAWWNAWIEKNTPTKLTKEQLEGLTKRWAFFDKSYRIDSKNFDDSKLLDWVKKTESNDQKNIAKENLMKFENIFLGVGADVLEFTSSVLTVNPDKALRAMKSRLDQTIKDVRNSGDSKKIEKLELELKRLNAIGGPDKIVPNEGIVFVYNGNTFKLTGAFASLNQLLGIFY